MNTKFYICIDLKSFYASVECVERGLDPMTTNLVVADPERTDKTICLAVSPSMKALGVKNRCRVFEIPKNIKYIMAPPRMQKYIDYSAMIYKIYLDFICPEDIHVYSIDEVFIDISQYLERYKKNPKELAIMLMDEVKNRLGIRATCGIGTNLYLAKIALDITAKHSKDFIGYLDEDLYCKQLWNHTPITDFWRIGPGTQNRLYRYGIYTMGQVANADENLLYRIFGIDAELLIDHAWGREPVTIKDIKNYKSKSSSLSSGQVLSRDYSFDEGKIIIKEMAESISLDLFSKSLLTDSITIIVGYSNIEQVEYTKGTTNFLCKTNANEIIISEISKLYERITNRNLKIRRLGLVCNRVVDERETGVQLSLFNDYNEMTIRSRKLQMSILELKRKYGKNSILKGIDFFEGATAIQRNCQIGGHKSG